LLQFEGENEGAGVCTTAGRECLSEEFQFAASSDDRDEPANSLTRNAREAGANLPNDTQTFHLNP
jgi:hypothetical protein